MIKGQRLGFRCLWAFRGLDWRMDRSPSTQRGKVGEAKSDHFVAFPAAERHRANSQPTSNFRLEDFQLKPAFAQVATNRDWLLWHVYATVAGW